MEAVSKNPYGSLNRKLGIVIASRDAVAEMLGFHRRSPSLGSRCALMVQAVGLIKGVRGGPIGVVKLLRARGGCLGVIRIRAWKAAKCPGELPNER